jgi:hypothetical protein
MVTHPLGANFNGYGLKSTADLDSPLSLDIGKKNQGALWESIKVVYFITSQQFFGRQVVYCFPIFVFDAGDLVDGSTFMKFVRAPVTDNELCFGRQIIPVGYH